MRYVRRLDDLRYVIACNLHLEPILLLVLLSTSIANKLLQGRRTGKVR